MESKHQIDLERQRISRDLHDNIGSQLTNIATKLEITAYQVGKNQSSEEIQERIEKVGDEARITIGLLRETIWAIQQDSFTLEEFAGKLQQHLERNISQPTVYNFNLEKPELNKTKKLNANQALNLFRIFQEAIQNITKHAQATEVNVGLDFTESKLVLSIRDNGLGMDLESAKNKQNHYGLKNMQARAEEIGAEMRVASELGKGALVEIGITDLSSE
jgi:signal transduction histidine kinase